jgi:hypothetical protein
LTQQPARGTATQSASALQARYCAGTVEAAFAPGPALAAGGGADEAAPDAAVDVETEAVCAAGVVGAGACDAVGEGTGAMSDALGAVTDGGAFDVSAQAPRTIVAARSSEPSVERGIRVSL